MLALIGSLLGSVGSSIIAPILGYFTSEDTIDLKAFQTGAAVDLGAYQAALNATVQVEQLRASQNMWWGARLIYLMAGLSACLHFSAVMLDSTFQFGWHVPKAPAPYDGYEWAVVQSFFLLTPAMPIASAVTAWLHRK
jgi:hypothetical protein